MTSTSPSPGQARTVILVATAFVMLAMLVLSVVSDRGSAIRAVLPPGSEVNDRNRDGETASAAPSAAERQPTGSVDSGVPGGIQTETPRLAILVTDQAGVGMEGAAVRVAGPGLGAPSIQVRTDGRGGSDVRLPGPGEYRIAASTRSGMLLGSARVTVSERGRASVRIRASDPHRVAGHVAGLKTGPAWVDAWAESSVYDLVGPPDASTPVAPDGTFRTEIRTEDVLLRARAPGLVPLEVAALDLRGWTQGLVELHLGPGRVVRGTVSAEDGLPCAGAAVHGGLAAGFGTDTHSAGQDVDLKQAYDGKAITGPSGRFVLEGVPPGTVPVRVEAEGLLPARVWISRAQERLSVVLRRGVSVEGRVVDSAGNGIGSAHLRFYGRRGSRDTYAGSDGSFVFRGVDDDRLECPGSSDPESGEVMEPRYALAAWAPGFRPTIEKSWELPTNAEISLDPITDAFSGFLQVPNGATARDYDLRIVSAVPERLCRVGGIDPYAMFGLDRVDISPTGELSADVASDAHAVLEVHHGAALVGRYPLAGQRLMIELPDTVPYRGRVLNHEGSAVQRFRVIVWPRGSVETEPRRGRPLDVVSDDGRFAVQAPRGPISLSVTVRARGFVPGDVELKPDEETAVVLRPTADLEVVLVRPSGAPYRGAAQVRLTDPTSDKRIPSSPPDGGIVFTVWPTDGVALFENVAVDEVQVSVALPGEAIVERLMALGPSPRQRIEIVVQ